ncbi:hypothetical protein LG293_16490 (plasmid) [Citricoccus nitrophenolicus]
MSENNPRIPVVRRHLGTTEGTPLLMGEDAMGMLAAHEQWTRYTGLPGDMVIIGTLCSSPIPFYREAQPGPRQFSEVNPAALWHPLFWLPNRLATPYTLSITDPETGEHPVEPIEAWSIRVALEMSVSGLYDPTEGWADILAMGGIDVTTQEGVGRVAAWQAGQPDELLDNIDLDRYLSQIDDPQWADGAVETLLPLLAEAHWALMAESILALLNDALANPDFALARGSVALACNVAAATLPQAPTLTLAVDAPPMEELFDKVRSAAQSWTGDRASFEAGPVRMAINWLTLLRDEHQHAVDAFEELQAQGA